MRHFRDRVDLSEVVRQHFSSVEKRYCIISPLFHRFDREWGTVFREEDQEQSVDETETVQDPKKLCWLLFLNAKDDILSGTEELIQTYHLLLCCLEFILRDSPAFLLHPPFDSLKLEHSAIGGSSPSLNFVQRLAEKFHTSLDELQAMQTTTQTYFESLKAANGNLDVTYLENQYLSQQKESGSLDELLSHTWRTSISVNRKSPAAWMSYCHIPREPVSQLTDRVTYLENQYLSRQKESGSLDELLYLQHEATLCLTSYCHIPREPVSQSTERVTYLENQYLSRQKESGSLDELLYLQHEATLCLTSYCQVPREPVSQSTERVTYLENQYLSRQKESGSLDELLYLQHEATLCLTSYCHVPREPVTYLENQYLSQQKESGSLDELLYLQHEATLCLTSYCHVPREPVSQSTERVTYLENQYVSRQKESGGLDELLYLQHEATLMPNNFSRVQSGSSTHNGLDTPVTPVRAAMNTVQQLKNLISANTDHLQPLREHFQNCASNPERSITDRASQMKLKFLSHYLETSGNGQGAVAEQRYRQATNLYYRVMKRLLDIERERLAPLKDFSSLLNNDVFHRSLLACSTEIVLTTYNVSWSMTHSVLNSGDSKFHFPWVLDVFELYAFDFYKHLTSIENRILDSVAWQSDSPDSPVFDLLSQCGAMSVFYCRTRKSLISYPGDSPVFDLLSHCGAMSVLYCRTRKSLISYPGDSPVFDLLSQCGAMSVLYCRTRQYLISYPGVVPCLCYIAGLAMWCHVCVILQDSPVFDLLSRCGAMSVLYCRTRQYLISYPGVDSPVFDLLSRCGAMPVLYCRTRQYLISYPGDSPVFDLLSRCGAMPVLYCRTRQYLISYPGDSPVFDLLSRCGAMPVLYCRTRQYLISYPGDSPVFDLLSRCGAMSVLYFRTRQYLISYPGVVPWLCYIAGLPMWCYVCVILQDSPDSPVFDLLSRCGAMSVILQDSPVFDLLSQCGAMSVLYCRTHQYLISYPGVVPCLCYIAGLAMWCHVCVILQDSPVFDLLSQCGAMSVFYYRTRQYLISYPDDSPVFDLLSQCGAMSVLYCRTRQYLISYPGDSPVFDLLSPCGAMSVIFQDSPVFDLLSQCGAMSVLYFRTRQYLISYPGDSPVFDLLSGCGAMSVLYYRTLQYLISYPGDSPVFDLLSRCGAMSVLYCRIRQSLISYPGVDSPVFDLLSRCGAMSVLYCRTLQYLISYPGVDSPVFDLLSRCGAMSSAYVSPCNDLISAENNNAAKAAEIYMSPSRGQATKGTHPGHIVIMSPRKGGVIGGVTMAYSKDSPETRAPDTPRRSHALTMFFNKVCRLGYHRLKTLADLLRITSETQQKIWTCFEFCIISRPELLKDRHLDQIMMCSVYGICKVSDCEIRFKDIVKEYSTMSHAMCDVYKQALLENGTHDSIISFYNRVFMQCMKNYILQFAKPVVCCEMCPYTSVTC
ncbi:hypothetical protein DPMN_140142 [Dreissena polymorpha]|uniref:HTH cro/C1-type domain-containing protein n=1 Tax=Dreissena polymorpha TaxID=45954 RepID=A0A9D4GD04_DREPO|nr:hypothetical protein DPMN_140142 [Dreissena polymorpha]